MKGAAGRRLAAGRQALACLPVWCQGTEDRNMRAVEGVAGSLQQVSEPMAWRAVLHINRESEPKDKGYYRHRWWRLAAGQEPPCAPFCVVLSERGQEDERHIRRCWRATCSRSVRSQCSIPSLYAPSQQ
eukprot:1146088-Pelagomonas_calceolata.AAC.2